MEESSVIFKGTVNGLTVILKEDEVFGVIYEQMEKKIASAGKFFKGAILDVRYRGRKLSKDEELKLFELLSNKSGAKIKSFSREAAQKVTVKEEEKTRPNNKIEIKKFYYFKGIDEGMTKFHKGTLRSGQLLSFDGNVVVLGDVNPGAEIVASGNVVVMGSLRGIVHAGADGNKDAVVVALNLQPTQLRIGEVITRPPDEKEQISSFIPEIAFIKDNTVYIERYLPQHK
ncbi:MAG: septum site-determining protein MinC [Bacillota bacterium]|nr:septum site-determining protein MinC [Bacillota bacterium]